MPGLDGTGPGGFRLFGRGMGRGIGMGFGRGMGAGRGMGWGRGGCGRGAWAGTPAAQDEKGALEARLAALENEAKEIKTLLSEKTGKKR